MNATSDNMSTVLIIDDDRDEANDTSFFLTNASVAPLHFEIVSPEVFPRMEDLLSKTNYSDFSAVLIDHRLGETATSAFNGLQLAEFLRTIHPSMPLFILTKYAASDELEKQGISVDDVMDKRLLTNHAETYVGRLLRAMSRFEESRSENSKRIYELVKTSLVRELSADEIADLNSLRASIGLWSLVNDIEETTKIRERLSEKAEIVKALEKFLNEDS